MRRRGVAGTTLTKRMVLGGGVLAGDRGERIVDRRARRVVAGLDRAAALRDGHEHVLPDDGRAGGQGTTDRAWQFIVLSLWIILSLPSFEWLLFGGPQEIHPARCWFLAILMVVGAEWRGNALLAS